MVNHIDRSVKLVRMHESDDLPFLVLRAATRVVEGIQVGMAERGFADVRPADGFVFLRIAGGGATTVEVARHLGVTKQAASQMIGELERKGYVARVEHPSDRRSRLVVLTARGVECTRAATEAARAGTAVWAAMADQRGLSLLVDSLRVYAGDGPIRPTW